MTDFLKRKPDQKTLDIAKSINRVQGSVSQLTKTLAGDTAGTGLFDVVEVRGTGLDQTIPVSKAYAVLAGTDDNDLQWAVSKGRLTVSGLELGKFATFLLIDA